MRRIIGIVMLALTMALCVSGCSDASKPSSSTVKSYDNELKKAEDKVMRHLTKKYDCQFECIGKNNPTYLQENYSFLVVSHEPEFDGEEFSAYYWPDTEEYRDNYWGVLVRGEIDSLLTKTLPETAKTFSQPSAGYFPDELSRDSTLSEAVPLSANIYIFTDKPTDIKKAAPVLEEAGIRGIIMYYCVDTEILRKIDYSSYQKIIAEITANKTTIQEQDSLPFGSATP